MRVILVRLSQASNVTEYCANNDAQVNQKWSRRSNTEFSFIEFNKSHWFEFVPIVDGFQLSEFNWTDLHNFVNVLTNTHLMYFIRTFQSTPFPKQHVRFAFTSDVICYLCAHSWFFSSCFILFARHNSSTIYQNALNQVEWWRSATKPSIQFFIWLFHQIRI